jgi:hypothetical protein
VATSQGLTSFARGLNYLYDMRRLAPEPEMVDVVHDLQQRIPICAWLGQHIDQVNQQLEQCLQDCHNCFHPWERPAIQIFATPLSQGCDLAGVCNFCTDPITILVDVGRVVPQDWLAITMHEYAHAKVGSPGHHTAFAEILTHLCLGLNVAPPVWQSAAEMENSLRFYPPCRSTPDPLVFWQTS